jgi:hypothetical protein
MEINIGVLNKTELPKNGITKEGFYELRNWFIMNGKDKLTQTLDEIYIPKTAWSKWMISEKGEYVGTWPKRFAKYCYEEKGIKFKSTDLAEIGAILSRHCERGTRSFFWQFCKHMEWGNGRFGERNHTSCWWTDNHYRATRLGIRHHPDTFTVLFYEDESGYIGHKETAGIGRCVGAKTEKGLVIFNAYGEYTLNRIAQVMATHMGLSYRRVMVKGHPNQMIYINMGNKDNEQVDEEVVIDGHHNGGSIGFGFLIGEEAIINGITDVNLPDFRFKDVNCEYCGKPLYSADSMHIQDRYYCDKCIKEHISRCELCHELTDEEGKTKVYYNGKYVDSCYRHEPQECSVHGKTLNNIYKVWHSKKSYCSECMTNGKATECEGCHHVVDNFHIINLQSRKLKLCLPCAKKVYEEIRYANIDPGL